MSCCSVKGAGPRKVRRAGSVPWVKPMGTVMAESRSGEREPGSCHPRGWWCRRPCGADCSRWVDDGVEVIALHRLGEGVAEGDLGRVVIDVGAGAAAVECGVRIGPGRRDRTVDLAADVRKVEAGVHDGLERVVGRVWGAGRGRTRNRRTRGPSSSACSVRALISGSVVGVSMWGR